MSLQYLFDARYAYERIQEAVFSSLSVFSSSRLHIDRKRAIIQITFWYGSWRIGKHLAFEMSFHMWHAQPLTNCMVFSQTRSIPKQSSECVYYIHRLTHRTTYFRLFVPQVYWTWTIVYSVAVFLFSAIFTLHLSFSLLLKSSPLCARFRIISVDDCAAKSKNRINRTHQTNDKSRLCCVNKNKWKWERNNERKKKTNGQ